MAEPAKNTTPSTGPTGQSEPDGTKDVAKDGKNLPTVLQSVEDEVEKYLMKGTLEFPPDYSYSNALKLAWYVIADVVDKSGNRAMTHCSPQSIRFALLNMTIQGLNPAKQQCWFIARAGRLTLQHSRFGYEMLVKRFKKLRKEPVSQIVYLDDEFEYDIVEGEICNIRHKQSPKNIDMNKIFGCYASLFFADGTEHSVFMTYPQIKECWEFGELKGKGSAHTRTPDEMCKRTVMNRACKNIIKGSNDAGLVMVKQSFLRTVNAEDRADAEADGEQNSRITDVSYMVEAADQDPPHEQSEQAAESPDQGKNASASTQHQPTQTDPAVSAQQQGEYKEEQAKF